MTPEALGVFDHLPGVDPAGGQGRYKASDAGARETIGPHALRLQDLQHAQVCEAARRAAAQHQCQGRRRSPGQARFGLSGPVRVCADTALHDSCSVGRDQ